MVKLNKIYTRTGDDGTTGLVDGSRLPKHDTRMEAIGAVDEANSALGLAAVTLADTPFADPLYRIQNDLFDLGADIATPAGDDDDFAPSEMVLRLHVARAAARRAERAMTAMAAQHLTNRHALAYINRLSDYLFVLARVANDDGRADVKWVPGANR